MSDEQVERFVQLCDTNQGEAWTGLPAVAIPAHRA